MTHSLSEWPGFIRDHSGYKPADLFVKRHYGSFKEEIMNYKHDMNMNKYKIIMIKAKKYIQTTAAKSIKSYTLAVPLLATHYRIGEGAPLLIRNLLAIIMYTDTTQLSTDFSASFRKIHQYETLSQIKKRNSKYWHWSKTLRETVELYGTYIIDHHYKGSIKGPFFTGISTVMNMPSSSLRLCSPTSTTVHIEVAVTFSGEQGLILQLKADEIIHSGYNFLRTLDVSWMSHFKEEDERYQIFYSCLFSLYSVIKLCIIYTDCSLVELIALPLSQSG